SASSPSSWTCVEATLLFRFDAPSIMTLLRIVPYATFLLLGYVEVFKTTLEPGGREERKEEVEGAGVGRWVGLTTLHSALEQALCACALVILLHSIDTLVLKTEGNTYRRCAKSPFVLRGNTNARLQGQYPECEACYYESLGFADHQQGSQIQRTSSHNRMKIHLLEDT
ncbi:hypothetical protein ZWY2020_021512, partial [Hordeum vulgare]